MNFRGIDATSPINRLKAGFCTVAVNVRRYLAGGFALRNPLTAAIDTTTSSSQSKSSGTAAQSGSGVTWLGIANIFNAGFGATFASVNLISSQTSNLLSVTALGGSGFSIPAGATITGIQVSYYSPAAGTLSCAGTFQLTQNGSPVGSTSGGSLGGSFGRNGSFGGMGNLLGYAWTPALLNGPTGLGLNVTCTGGTLGHFATATINSLVITVYYTIGGPLSGFPTPIHTIRRLNDSTPNGPPAGYVLVIGAAGAMYVNTRRLPRD